MKDRRARTMGVAMLCGYPLFLAGGALMSLWACRVPGTEGWSLLVAIGCWLIVALGILVELRYRMTHMGGRALVVVARRGAITLAVGGVVLVACFFQWPIALTFQWSRPALEAAAASAIQSCSAGPTFDGTSWIGLYRVTEIEVRGDAVIFALHDAGFLFKHGFAHCPTGPPPNTDRGHWWQCRHLIDDWYICWYYVG